MRDLNGPILWEFNGYQGDVKQVKLQSFEPLILEAKKGYLIYVVKREPSAL